MISETKLRKNRCQICNKKCGLILIECKCGGKFCLKHRYIDSHKCEFDHISLEIERLRQSNLVVVCDKVNNRI